MRDQYAGDVSDFLKFAFLRALAGADRKLGVAWYYVPDNDGRPDGKHLEWHDEPAWRQLDVQLHNGLLALRERTIAALELADIWPDETQFHREPMPNRLNRSSWAVRKREALNNANLVFLDPNNGLGADTVNHATLSEVRLLRRLGRSIAFITFPGKNLPHDTIVQQLHEKLKVEADADLTVTLRTNVAVPRGDGSPYYVQRPRWFTLVDPDRVLIDRTRKFAENLRLVPRVSAKLDENFRP